MVAIPPSLLLFNTLFWITGTKIVKVCGGKAKKTPMNLNRLFNRIAILSGLVLYIIYPNIIELLLHSVNCFPSLKEFPNGDTTSTDVNIERLRIYPNIECDDPRYTMHKWALFVPALIFYMLVVPLGALYHMCRSSRTIYLSSEVRA